MRANSNFDRLEQSYLFSTVARKVAAFKQANPDVTVIKMGIGDVTQPLAPSIITALSQATKEMSQADTFRGYCDDAEGYEFLRAAVTDHYARLGADLGLDEVFISDGAKSDLGNILDIIESGSKILIPDPVYPAYVDTNVMNGNTILYSKGTIENGFAPLPDDSVDVDVVYICSPNNPTGAVYTAEGLAAWVAYALEHNALIIFDSAYEAFIREPGLPHTIYEIEGAEKCAIEISSFSKRAGFTGVRCGFTVVPRNLEVCESNLNAFWRRRQNTKFNGVPYIVQRAAQAALSETGRKETAEQVDTYLRNAQIIGDAFDSMGIAYTGGRNAPYIWARCPKGMCSWDFFDLMLEKAHCVATPGVGFGSAGEGFVRFSAFGRTDDCKTAMERIQQMLEEEELI
ncbi:MAG: LL-diaminopimelate aminotransferase [Coriobacteriales bacterium]|nr:LL-diaminopimelate aminotransferase [Coriobacteriales bacterium]